MCVPFEHHEEAEEGRGAMEGAVATAEAGVTDDAEPRLADEGGAECNTCTYCQSGLYAIGSWAVWLGQTVDTCGTKGKDWHGDGHRTETEKWNQVLSSSVFFFLWSKSSSRSVEAVEAMDDARARMDARLTAIRASLKESRMLLASCAQRLDVKEQEWEAATTSSLFVPDGVREKLEAKSSSTSLISTHLVMSNGALHTDVTLGSVTRTRCSTLCSDVNVGNNLDAVVFPASGTTHIPSTTLSVAGNGMTQGAGVSATNTLAVCSSHVLTSPREGLVDGARVVTAVNTNHTHNNAFPRFDGTDPGLWRVQCLDYFNRFNINKCMWVVAARMHMDGKAKEWFEAYRLRQVVSDWPEFINDVEAHFGVGDLPPLATILGTGHSTVVVHVSGHISPGTPTRCLPVSPKEVMATTSQPTEPTLLQLVDSIKLQFAQLKLALTSEYEGMNNRNLGTQMAGPIVDSSEEVLTHVSGVSMFLEPSVEPAEAVFAATTLIELVDDVITCVGGLSLFLELDMDSANKVFADDVITTVGGVSLFLDLDKVSVAVLLENVSRPDEVLTYVGGLSLFLEFDRDLSLAFDDE
ncbi:hypothetical protein QYE76_036002, partial [Lolium multiflorum]